MSEITDPVERIVADALSRSGVAFVHESADKAGCSGLDFYLPDYGLSIEVCAFYTPRKIDQMGRVQNGILIQGRKAAEAFAAMLLSLPTPSK